MGNKSVKEKNQLLTDQAKRSQGVQNELNEFGRQDRGYQTGVRDFVTDQYKNLFSGIGSEGSSSGGGGGGGGGSFSGIKALPTTSLNFADPRMNEAMEGFREFSKTGGFTDPQAQDFRARATSTLPSFFEGLKTQLGAANRAAGGNIGFNSQMAKLAREKAFGSNQVASDAEANLQDQIRSNRFKGLEGVGRHDTELMDRLSSVEKSRNEELLRQNQDARNEQLRQEAAEREFAAQQAAAANSRRASSDDDFRRQMAILGELRGVRGEQGTDLDYFRTGGQFGSQATQNIGSRETEPGFFDRLGQIAAPVASAFAGGFGGGIGSGIRDPRKKVDFGDLRGEGGLF